jgi:hypothetical protein
MCMKKKISYDTVLYSQKMTTKAKPAEHSNASRRVDKTNEWDKIIMNEIRTRINEMPRRCRILTEDEGYQG